MCRARFKHKRIFCCDYITSFKHNKIIRKSSDTKLGSKLFYYNISNTAQSSVPLREYPAEIHPASLTWQHKNYVYYTYSHSKSTIAPLRASVISQSFHTPAFWAGISSYFESNYLFTAKGADSTIPRF